MTESAQQLDDTPQNLKPSILRRLAVFGLVLFLGLQLVPIDRHNPEVIADINAPEDVKLILRRACYDCHSNETKWPWYSYVAPGSWLMAKDVREGRNYLNFSEWGDYYELEETPEYFLEECFGSIESGDMPLWFYIPMHPEAKLSVEDLKILKDWCKSEKSVISEEIEEDLES